MSTREKMELTSSHGNQVPRNGTPHFMSRARKPNTWLPTISQSECGGTANWNWLLSDYDCPAVSRRTAVVPALERTPCNM